MRAGQRKAGQVVIEFGGSGVLRRGWCPHAQQQRHDRRQRRPGTARAISLPALCSHRRYAPVAHKLGGGPCCPPAPCHKSRSRPVPRLGEPPLAAPAPPRYSAASAVPVATERVRGETIPANAHGGIFEAGQAVSLAPYTTEGTSRLASERARRVAAPAVLAERAAMHIVLAMAGTANGAELGLTRHRLAVAGMTVEPDMAAG